MSMIDKIDAVLAEVRKVILGKDEVVIKVFMSILASGHILLEDVPGVGKTTLALAFARAMDLDTKRVQFTSDTVPSDVVGISVLDKDTGEFAFKPGAIMTNILLADEINRTSSKTQSALLEAMEESNVTVDGTTYPLPAPFTVLATQNPFGAAGTLLLPPSQLDRFMIRVSMGYPNFESQVNILQDREKTNPLEKARRVINKSELTAAISAVADVYVDGKIYEYITSLTEATRAHPLVAMGVSPRGALALCRIAKAKAFATGRSYVVPEDVSAMASDVFAHRLILNAKARFDEAGAGDVIADILESTPMPVLRELSPGREYRGAGLKAAPSQALGELL